MLLWGVLNSVEIWRPGNKMQQNPITIWLRNDEISVYQMLVIDVYGSCDQDSAVPFGCCDSY